MSRLRTISHSKPTLNRNDVRSISRQLKSLNVAAGDATAKFESAVGAIHGYQNSRSCPSGAAALEQILNDMQIGRGHEVLVSRYVCESVPLAISRTGAKPVFYEVNEIWQPHAPSVLSRISKQTKAVVLVHIYGIDATFERIHEIDVPIIDDLCQAFGLKPRHGRQQAAFFSFNATKCLTTGEGGAYCLTPDLIQTSKANRRQGSRLSDLQSSLGLSQLEQYEFFLSRRRQIAEYYLQNLRQSATVNTIAVANRSLWFRFPVSINLDFEDLRKFMWASGVAVRRGVDRLLQSEHESNQDRELTSRVFDSTASIPIYPSLTRKEIARVTDVFNSIVVE